MLYFSKLRIIFISFTCLFFIFIALNNFLDPKNKLIQKKINLGLPLDSSLNTEFENNQRHKNYIFSKGIDLIHEFFNFERNL